VNPIKPSPAGAVSVVVVFGFISVLALLLWHGMPPGIESLVTVLFTALATAFGTVVNYWLGSSAGSARKDAMLLAATPPIQPDKTPS
jgi:membrane protein YqaA with SNARE-associated domain